MSGRYDRILIPTNGSYFADQAFNEVLKVAEGTKASIHVLYIVDHLELIYLATDFGPEVVPPESDVGGLYRRNRGIGESAISRLAETASAAGYNVATEIRYGAPAGAILEYASENDIDLIVMGTHGRRGIKRILRGSTTEQVLRHSSLPVLAVPDVQESVSEN